MDALRAWYKTKTSPTSLPNCSHGRLGKMQRSKCLEREQRLVTERSIKRWGTANVNINILEFPNKKDEENVETLVELFKDDFRGLNPRYHIPAKIDRQDLDTALAISGLTIQNLTAIPDLQYGYLELKFPAGFRLNGCQGIHRAKAAARILPPGARSCILTKLVVLKLP